MSPIVASTMVNGWRGASAAGVRRVCAPRVNVTAAASARAANNRNIRNNPFMGARIVAYPALHAGHSGDRRRPDLRVSRAGADLHDGERMDCGGARAARADARTRRAEPARPARRRLLRSSADLDAVDA